MEINQVSTQNSSGLNSYRAAEAEKPRTEQNQPTEQPAPRTDRVEISAAAKAKLSETTEPVEPTATQQAPAPPEPAPKPEDITTYNAAGMIAG